MTHSRKIKTILIYLSYLFRAQALNKFKKKILLEAYIRIVHCHLTTAS
jgi:hypothetical protein